MCDCRISLIRRGVSVQGVCWDVRVEGSGREEGGVMEAMMCEITDKERCECVRGCVGIRVEGYVREV